MSDTTVECFPQHGAPPSNPHAAFYPCFGSDGSLAGVVSHQAHCVCTSGRQKFPTVRTSSVYVTLPTVPSQPSNTWEMPNTDLFTLQTGNPACKQTGVDRTWPPQGRSRGNAQGAPDRYLYSHVQGSIIHTSQRAINRRVDKPNVVSPYNGLLFSHRKRNSGICYNMDES